VHNFALYFTSVKSAESIWTRNRLSVESRRFGYTPEGAISTKRIL
jgi:hypothetical protein